jgi:FkbM family methyltransferase
MKDHRFWPPNGDLSNMIRKHFPEGYLGHAIDVGASDGVSVNTTYVLEKRDRWTVLNVEPNPEYKDYLQANRAFIEMCACGAEPQDGADFHIHLDNPESFSALEVSKHSLVRPRVSAKWSTIKVPVRTVAQLLAKWDFPRLDALCVDTEGTEIDVLNGCDLERWTPRVIVVECWDKTGGVHDYLRERGYGQVDTTADNYVYLRGKR